MSGLFKTPKMPEIKPPTPMPDESNISAAGKRRTAKEVAGAGAQSTILNTGTRETLGA